MPSGKELEQLPMTHVAPGMGKDFGPFERQNITRYVDEVRPMPSKVGQESKGEK